MKQLHSEDNPLVRAYAESRIGGRAENQDNYGWTDTKLGFLVTVCDGMGGGPGGRTASWIAVDAIVKTMHDADEDADISQTLTDAIKNANTQIREYAEANPKLKGMGSTATVLLVNENSAFIAHVGDSRVYQVRGKRKVFRTFDHSQVFRLVQRGVITEEQARLSAESNIITRALGIADDVEVDVAEVTYLKGDRFILCSDGIHGTMPEKQLLKMFGSKKHPLADIPDVIADYVDEQGKNNGNHHDNLTMAMVEMRKSSKLTPKMSNKHKIIFSVLAILCLASIILNVMQYKGDKSGLVQTYADSIAVLSKSDSIHSDSVKMLKDSIQAMGKKTIENKTN